MQFSTGQSEMWDQCFLNVSHYHQSQTDRVNTSDTCSTYAPSKITVCCATHNDLYYRVNAAGCERGRRPITVMADDKQQRGSVGDLAQQGMALPRGQSEAGPTCSRTAADVFDASQQSPERPVHAGLSATENRQLLSYTHTHVHVDVCLTLPGGQASSNAQFTWIFIS